MQHVPKSDRWELLNAREYIEYMNEAAANDDYGENYFGDPDDPSLADTDWQEEVLRTAPVSDINLGVSGGTDRIQYYLSGSYFDQEGVALGSGYARGGGRVNLDFQPTSRLSFRSSLSLNQETHDRIEGDDTIEGPVANAIANPAWVPVRRDDGTFTSQEDGLGYANSLALATFSSIETRSQRALGNVEAGYIVTDGLTLNGRVGADVIGLRDLRWESPKVEGTYCGDVAGCSTHGTASATRYVAESFATYNRPTGIATALSLTAGTSIEWNNEETNYIRGEGFSTEEFQYPGNASRVTSYDADWTGHHLASFFGRANATLLDRYLVTTSVRVDGSSRFGENHKWGVFPAVSLGWNLTDEAFAASLSDVAELKLRGSYGITGNQDISDDFAPLARFGNAKYGDIAGIAQNSFANPELRWESTREYDLGFDLSLLEGRVAVIGDWYRKATFDLLLDRPITTTSGQTTIFENVGNMVNRGFELNLNTINLRDVGTMDFGWTSDFNISWNKNEVTKLFRNEPFMSGANRVAVGLPLGAFYAIRFLGVDPATGDAIYDDVDGDGDITSSDRVVIGSPHPDYWGGFTNTFTAGPFDLRGFLQFSHGAMVYTSIGLYANDAGYYEDNKFRSVLRRWQQPGDITDEPRASYDGLSGAADLPAASSRHFQDASYVRLQEVTLGYRLPVQLLGGVGLNEGRFYVSGRNLATWTDYTGYNPEPNSNGSSSNIALGEDFYSYPLARSFTIGISSTW
jgi:TonB-linked SusC/RagA family outer membrane protein